MESAEWTLVFFVKSSAVALNTVELVNTTMYVVMIFSLFMAAGAANKAKSDFLANMSHDIRTPMNAIVGITNLMPHVSHDPEKVEEYTRKIQASSRHLLGLINDVLDMSKIETIIRPQTVARRQSFVIRVNNIQHENIFCGGTRLQQAWMPIFPSPLIWHFWKKRSVV